MAKDKPEKAMSKYCPEEICESTYHDLKKGHRTLIEKYKKRVLHAILDHEEEKGEANVKEGLAEKVYSTAEDYVLKDVLGFDVIPKSNNARGQERFERLIQSYHGLSEELLEKQISNTEPEYLFTTLEKLLDATIEERLVDALSEDARGKFNKIKKDDLPYMRDYIASKAKDVGMKDLDSKTIVNSGMGFEILSRIIKQELDQELMKRQQESLEEQLKS